MREKQIEEIGKIICGMENGCDGCMWNKARCNERNYAEEIYNAGYRKQSKGEWKILKMGDGEKVRTCSACLISQTINVYKGKVMFRYCPYCGANMEGGE